MFHPESNPLAPKPSGPLKPEKELVEIWLGKEAAALMGDEKPETGDEDLNFDSSLTEKEKQEIKEAKENEIWPRKKYIKWAESFGEDAAWVDKTFVFHKDGTTSIEEDLYLHNRNISNLPRGWRKVGSTLDLSYNQLTTLEGLPNETGGDTRLDGNQLASLKGLPKKIGGDLSLFDNPAESIPPGLMIGGKVYLSKSQTVLAEDAKRKGYRVTVF